ncbi:RHS repeat domain-containing protein, partial [Tenacibaculum larymnensis]
INYNKPQNGATALFNGNISETHWNTLNTDTSTRSYSYEFDALNRLVSATGNIDRYDLSSVTYDKNGNIKTLVRKGHLNVGATSFGTMDDLTYTYDNGNKLMRISDGATIDQFGFKDDVLGGTVDTTDDYTYDANGNMLTDTNKGITSNITYNHLNLPVQINVDGQLINYTYDASGAKLKKVSNGVTTEYAGGFRYVNNDLKDFKHAEGYVKKDGSGFNYVYSYTDHLGNVRLNYADLNNDGVIQAASEILDEKNYYPFGGTHEGYNTAINGAYYPFGYNGKEENDENGLATLDFGARNYDKWAGRWMNLDPLAEQMRRHSPYNFAFDNPVYFIDPDGMAPMGPGDLWRKIKQTIKDDIAAAPRRFKKMMSDLNSLFGSIDVQGNHKDKIGSGVVIVGSGSTTDSNTISENPSEDVYIPEDALTTMAKYAKLGPKSTSKGKNYGPNKAKGKKGKNFASQMKKGIKDAKARKKKMDAIGSGIDLMTSDGTINASNTAGEPNSTSKVKIRITNVASVAPAFGNNGHRVTTIKKDTLVNPQDVNRVQQEKTRKLEEAQNPNN